MYSEDMGNSRIARSSNFELLRLISIFLIELMHFSGEMLNGAFLVKTTCILVAIQSIGQIGVTCFILISGYFGIKRDVKKIIQLILITTFYSIFCACFQENVTGASLLISCLVIPLYKNWFIACYLILILISPYINDFLATLEKKNYNGLFFILLVSLSIIPTFTNSAWETVIDNGGKCLLYMIFVYIIGRGIRIHYNYVILPRILIWAVISVNLIINILNISLSFFFNKTCSVFALDCSPFILFEAVCIFYLFKYFTFSSKFINYLAASVLAIFLLDGMRPFYNQISFNLSSQADSPFLIPLIFVETLSFCFLAIIIDKARSLLFSKTDQKIATYLYEQLRKLNQYVILHLNQYLR